jgi:hypothetical protein
MTLLTAFLTLALAGPNPAPPDSSELLQHFAPIYCQEVGSRPKEDAITRFDFDGNQVGTDNWKNLDSSPTPAYVYGSVVSTATHHFLFYLFFHPRDVRTFCLTWVCHENDLEGALLVVRREPEGFGKAVLAQTLAHDFIFTREMNGGPFLIRSEAGKHGLHPLASLEEMRGPFLKYAPDSEAQDPRGASQGTFTYVILSTFDLFWKPQFEAPRSDFLTEPFEYRGARFRSPRLI